MNLALFVSIPLMGWLASSVSRKGEFPERLKFYLELFFIGVYPLLLSIWSDHTSFRILFIITSISYWCSFNLKKVIVEGILFSLIVTLYYFLWPLVVSQKTLIGILYIPFGLFFFFGVVAGRYFPSRRLAWTFNILYLLLMYVLIQMILEIGI